MKQIHIKRLSIILSLLLALSLCACGSPISTNGGNDKINSDASVEMSDAQSTENYSSDETSSEIEISQPEEEIKTQQISHENLRYVMIYNPKIYKEDNKYNGNLNTGFLGEQIDTTMTKSDGLDSSSDYPFLPFEQGSIDPDIPFDEINWDGDRGEIVMPTYSVGDEKSFYCFDIKMNRTLKDFTCLYAGQYCNVWSYDNNFNSYAALIYGMAFDEDIDTQMLESFGSARFTENGGKVNLLFYPMADGLAGCYTTADLFSNTEVTENMIATYGLNTNYAILNINSSYAIYQDFVELMCSTMAHEFQHLICATDSIYALNSKFCSSWLNEAMSGYAEEKLYPGAKELGGHYTAFAKSDRIRNGQSLYNFETDENDIGVYGSVYLFAEYLANLTVNNTVYRDFHNDWRESYSKTICDEEGLYSVVPSSVIDEIMASIKFSDNITFKNKQEELMSKITLDFYLSLLSNGEGTPSAYDKVDPFTLLYDEVGAAKIEGGGRVIIALKDNIFEIPEDADEGLIYIGLDENFQPITDFISN